MKQLLLSICMLLLMQAAYAQKSCCQSKEAQWAKEHVGEIQNMTRKDLIAMERPMQVAVWQYLTAQQKYMVWKDKLAEVKHMDWSKKEMKHLQKLETYIDTHKDIIFAAEGQKDKDVLAKYMQEWSAYAQKQLGWSERLCAAMGMSIYPLKGKTGEVVMPS